MKITKGGSAAGSTDAAAELDAINAFTKTELSQDEVYTFSVLLCDNEVDRDFERFDEQTLNELRELFVGKTGISDHNWSSGNQKARIYRTEIVSVPERKTAAGTDYVYLKAHAYMLRTEGNAELIAEIDGGIKKETSVGCSVAESICSICGEPIGSTACPHVRGKTYDGKLCYAELHGATDAYEWSFVAVPAQKNSGVMKGFCRCSSLKELAVMGGMENELADLEKLADLGKTYLSETRKEVLRLGLLCDEEMFKALELSSSKMDGYELAALKSALEKRVREKLPPVCQLPGRKETVSFDGGEYTI